MPLSGSALSAQLQSAMYGIDVQATAISTLASTVSSYITTNTLVTYSWVGTNAATGAVDPTVTFTALLSGSFSLTTPTDVSNLALQIQTGILQLTLTATDPTFALALLLNPGGTVTIVMSGEDSFSAAMDSLASQIVSSMQTFLNTTPIAGTHSAFTGTATMVSIA